MQSLSAEILDFGVKTAHTIRIVPAASFCTTCGWHDPFGAVLLELFVLMALPLFWAAINNCGCIAFLTITSCKNHQIQDVTAEFPATLEDEGL
jgi:hypothetical protein